MIPRSCDSGMAAIASYRQRQRGSFIRATSSITTITTATAAAAVLLLLHSRSLWQLAVETNHIPTRAPVDAGFSARRELVVPGVSISGSLVVLRKRIIIRIRLRIITAHHKVHQQFWLKHGEVVGRSLGSGALVQS